MFVQPLLFTLHSADCTPRHQESSIMKYRRHHRSIVIHMLPQNCKKNTETRQPLGVSNAPRALWPSCKLSVSRMESNDLSEDVRCETETRDTGESSCRLGQEWVYYLCAGHQRLVFSCDSEWFLSHNQEVIYPGFIRCWIRTLVAVGPIRSHVCMLAPRVFLFPPQSKYVK